MGALGTEVSKIAIIVGPEPEIQIIFAPCSRHAVFTMSKSGIRGRRYGSWIRSEHAQLKRFRSALRKARATSAAVLNRNLGERFVRRLFQE